MSILAAASSKLVKHAVVAGHSELLCCHLCQSNTISMAYRLVSVFPEVLGPEGVRPPQVSYFPLRSGPFGDEPTDASTDPRLDLERFGALDCCFGVVWAYIMLKCEGY